MEPYNIWFLCLASFAKHGFEADLFCSMYQDFISFYWPTVFQIDILHFFNPFMCGNLDGFQFLDTVNNAMEHSCRSLWTTSYISLGYILHIEVVNHMMNLYLMFFVCFPFIFISWRLITLQYCSGFCHTLTWISHGFTCIPHPNPIFNFLRNFQTVFPEWLHYFAFPSAVRVLISLHPHQLVILVVVYCYATVGLICIPWWLIMLSILLCVYWSFICIFALFKFFAYFKIGSFSCTAWVPWSSGYDLQIFSPFFHFLLVSF